MQGPLEEKLTARERAWRRGIGVDWRSQHPLYAHFSDGISANYGESKLRPWTDMEDDELKTRSGPPEGSYTNLRTKRFQADRPVGAIRTIQDAVAEESKRAMPYRGKRSYAQSGSRPYRYWKRRRTPKRSSRRRYSKVALPSVEYCKRLGRKIRLSMSPSDRYYLERVKVAGCAINTCGFAEFILNDHNDIAAAAANYMIDTTTGSCHIKRSSLHVRMANNSNVLQYIKVFWMTPRHYLDATFLPETYIETVDDDFATTANSLYGSPFMYTEMSKHFKIKAGKTEVIRPGEEKVFNMYNNRPWNYYAGEWTRESYRMGRVSKVALVKFWGQIATDSDNTNEIGTVGVRFECISTSCILTNSLIDDDIQHTVGSSQLTTLADPDTATDGQVSFGDAGFS